MATVRKEVQLNEDNFNRFKEHFPDGSLSWALDLLLGKFMDQYKHTPQEYAELAAKELKEEITK